MRILHWNDGFFPHIGGTEVFVRALCREQMARGHQVAVAAGALPGRDGEDEDEIDGIRVYRRPVPDVQLASDPGVLRRLVDACRATKRMFRPDIVHVHGSGIGPWLHLLSRDASPCPAVVTLHTGLKEVNMPRNVKIRVLRAADAVTVNSESVRRDVTALCGWRDEDVPVVYYGVEWPELEPGPLRWRPATALCLGRMVNEKGFDVALRVLDLVPGLRLIVAGDGVALVGLKRLAADLRLTPRVEFRGWVHPDAVPALFNEAALMLMPSRWQEAFGVVALQAAQMGRPVVASRVGGIPEVVEDGATGILVPPDDPGAMAGALRELLENPARAEAMGARARERAREKYSIARSADEYEAIYERVREERS